MDDHVDEIFDLAEILLEQAGFSKKIISIKPIYKGGNNQLYHIRHNEHQFTLKKYYKHPDDERNRLGAEFSFLIFANKWAPNYVPKAFAKDDGNSIALYEYIEGSKLSSGDEITQDHIDQAANFIWTLNENNGGCNSTLQNASEACFSLRDHVTKIETRVNELESESNNNTELSTLISSIKSIFINLQEEIDLIYQYHGISPYQILDFNERVISPSDFGFHNAIIQDNGNVIFIDFEYSGWDDPAKMISDFFNQVAIPIKAKYLNNFISAAFKKNQLSQIDEIRIKYFIKLYRVKWCCIVLNIFLKKNFERRIFSNPNLNLEQLQKAQIFKAKSLLESLKV